MSVQIVISGNRVLAHGTGFSVSGDSVENESTSRVYKNATIATVESVPDDIDSVGYEYHAGRFVPCGPFGIGKGNVAVVCNADCKALKDSGIPMESFAASEYTTYEVYSYSGAENMSLTFNISPDVIFITSDESPQCNYLGVIIGNNLLCICSSLVECVADVTRRGKTVSWEGSLSHDVYFTRSQVTYKVYAFSVKGA